MLSKETIAMFNKLAVDPGIDKVICSMPDELANGVGYLQLAANALDQAATDMQTKETKRWVCELLAQVVSLIKTELIVKEGKEGGR